MKNIKSRKDTVEKGEREYLEKKYRLACFVSSTASRKKQIRIIIMMNNVHLDVDHIQESKVRQIVCKPGMLYTNASHIPYDEYILIKTTDKLNE